MRTISDILQGDKDFGAFIVKCHMDFKFFAERVLGLEILPYHMHWVESFLTRHRSCMVAPRGSGKTWVLGVAFPIWVSMYMPQVRFLITASSKEKSKDILKEIRGAIEDNELLSALLIPEGKNKSWSSVELKMKTGTLFSVRAFTAKGIRGKHNDFVLFDEGGEIDGKYVPLFFDVVAPTVNHKNGNLMVIGTPKTETDLLAVLRETSRGYYCRVYTMWDESTHESLWPSKFNKEKLDSIRNEVGAIAFRREYMCEIVDEGVQPFSMSDVVHSYDLNMGFDDTGREYKSDDGSIQWGNYFIGVDLAMSPQGDYSVYTVVEAMGEKVVIKKIVRVRGIHYKSQEEMVKQLCDNFKPTKVIVDKSVFGEVFISDLRDMGIAAEPFSFTPDNRNLILNNLMRLFESNKVTIPRHKDDGDCIEETINLTEELQKIIFTTTQTGMRTFHSVGKHDDSVMSFALAAWAATEFGPACEHMEALADPRATSYGDSILTDVPYGNPLGLSRPPIGW